MNLKYQMDVEAIIAKAKAILSEGKSTSMEMSRVMTDGRNEYTHNIGGVFSARTEMEFYLKEECRKFMNSGAFSELEPALDWMTEEAAKLGVEL